MLMFGELPTHTQLKDFEEVLTSLQELSGQFVRDVIMKAPSANIMNALQKSVLTLYSYDENPDDISVANVLRQSLQLIGKIPLIAVYAYLSYRHFGFDDNLYIRTPDKDLSIAENILQMVRQDGKFTELEAKVLDIALVIMQNMAAVITRRLQSCSNVFRHRYIFCDFSIHCFTEGTTSWWCQLKSSADV